MWGYIYTEMEMSDLVFTCLKLTELLLWAGQWWTGRLDGKRVFVYLCNPFNKSWDCPLEEEKKKREKAIDGMVELHKLFVGWESKRKWLDC